MPETLRQLTSLRFFAAAWVVAYHYWPQLTGSRPAFIEKGYLGVELFFVLSGFILSHVYLEAAGAGRLNYREFLWARLARIYPVHLATFLAVGLMGLAALMFGVKTDHPVMVWSAVIPNLALVHAWGTVPVASWNHPSWSISAEWFAYLTFPLFASIAWRMRMKPALAVIGATLLILAVYPLFEDWIGFPLTRATIAWGVLRIVPCFALGCAVNLLWRQRPLHRAAAAFESLGCMLTIAASCLLNGPDQISVIVFGAFIYGLASLASSGSRFMTAPVLVYLGEVSFAVYMVCIPWQLAFGKFADRALHAGPAFPVWLWLIQAAGVLPVAMLVHHLIERPARSWMRDHTWLRSGPGGVRPAVTAA